MNDFLDSLKDIKNELKKEQVKKENIQKKEVVKKVLIYKEEISDESLEEKEKRLQNEFNEYIKHSGIKKI